MVEAVGDHALGLIFHHFVGGEYPFIQGALKAEELHRLLSSMPRGHLLSPEEWVARSIEGRLDPRDRCLTFDDALASQIDIALPVLDDLGLKAFFFVYSSVFRGKLEMFELIRYFRNTRFGSVDAFYDAFYEALSQRADWPEIERTRDSTAAFEHLSAYAFYSEADRRFRYVRDRILPASDYDATCLTMMNRLNYDLAEAARAIWMSDDDLRRLAREGHRVGLHSDTHPTNLGTWRADLQLEEYSINLHHLTDVLGARPDTVAYPSGSYDDATLAIMRDFGIVVGFMSGHQGDPRNLLEQPRLDWTQIEKD